MRILVLLILLASLASATPLPGLRRQTESDGALNNETASLLDALSQANLTALHTFFVSYPAVLQTVIASPGLKTLLAPDDDAMDAIPEYCTSSSTCYQSTILMHILNGTFDVNELEPDPMHTVGHSFLTDSRYANLPGGNGQAIALSLASYATNTTSTSSAEGTVGASTAKVQEALNVDAYLTAGRASQVGNFTLQPIDRAMTVPGGPLATLRIVGRYSRFLAQIEEQADHLNRTISQMRGVTIFAPTDDAWEQFEDANGNVTGSAMSSLILNHFVANRAVYSPLLADQGSMVTMAGQDIVYNAEAGSVTIGTYSANITQYDIMHRGGVIHSIDAVLADTSKDAQRASQAADSALNSAISGLSGPVSTQNAASSQGDRVPVSASATNGKSNVNSTITTTSQPDQVNDPSDQKSSSAPRAALQSTFTFTAVSLAAMLLLLVE